MARVEPMSQSKPTRILYIEDDRDLAALVSFRLSKAGYVVDIAHNGAEGIAKFDSGSHDLVAVDHSIPVHDGLEVIGIMASRGPLPPTIMITGSGDEKIAVETMKRGADDYIVKDVGGGWLDLLPGVIKHVLAQRRLVREKERVERELRESERRCAEAEKLAAVSRIAARVAHEINNPLAGIKSSFQLVKNAVPKGHPDLIFAEVIDREIERIADIVSQMYELYPTNQGQISSIRVGEVMNEVVAMMKEVASEKQVRLENRTEDPGVIAVIPEGSLRQVAYNLLINAIESSPPGGTVSVEAKATGKNIEITVADQGPGIPSEIRDLVFEPFFTTKNRETNGGLGLGLSISRGIVKALQGTLDHESPPGVGTIFRVTIPLKAP